MAENATVISDKAGVENALPQDMKKLSVRPPCKKKYEEVLESLNSTIKEKETELKKLSGGADDNLSQKLRDIRAEKDATISRRKKIDSDLRALNQDISKQNAVLTKVQSNLQYKNEERINEAIGRLENQLKSTNFRLSEERKIVAEIDALKRSKKALGQYMEVKKHIDDLRSKQRRMREERDLYFKTVTQLKQREESFKQSAQSKRTQTEQLKSELERLNEEKREHIASYRIQEKEYQRNQNEMRRRQREEFIRRREKEKRLQQEQYEQDLAEYEASREPFEDERLLCSTLIAYLQRHLAPTATTPTDTVDGGTSPDGVKDIEVQGMFVLKKKTDDDLTSPRSKASRKGRKERKKAFQNKPIVHTPQIFKNFSSLNLAAPSSTAEVAASLDALQDKKMEFEARIRAAKSGDSFLASNTTLNDSSDHDVASAGALSFTESAISESIPSTPEVFLDGPPKFPREGSGGASPNTCSETRQRKLSHDSGACELEEQVICEETEVASSLDRLVKSLPDTPKPDITIDSYMGSVNFSEIPSETDGDREHQTKQINCFHDKSSQLCCDNIGNNAADPSYSVNFPTLGTDDKRLVQDQSLSTHLSLPGGSSVA